jgi:hypothetical protein
MVEAGQEPLLHRLIPDLAADPPEVSAAVLAVLLANSVAVAEPKALCFQNPIWQQLFLVYRVQDAPYSVLCCRVLLSLISLSKILHHKPDHSPNASHKQQTR